MKKRSTHKKSVMRVGPLLMALWLLCWSTPSLADAAPPVITSLSATTGMPVTGSIVINGTGFNDTPSRNVVLFGDAVATVISATSTALTVTVPVGSIYSQISVLDLNTRLSARSAQYFTPTFNPMPYIPYSRAFKTQMDITVPPTLGSTGALNYLALTGDIDGDGKVDLIVSSYDSFLYARSPISIYRNIGGGGIIAYDTPVVCTSSFGARNIRLADLDGDGKLDIVAAASGSGRISAIRNLSTPGNISMALNVNLALTTGAYETAVADFDGDGRLDIAAACFSANNIQVYRNKMTTSPVAGFTNSGSFTNYHVDFPAGNGPVSIAAADFDGDGKMDLVISDNGSDQLTILKNNSVVDSFMFSTAATLTVPSQPLQVITGDFNNDGKPDIVVPCFGASSVVVLQNNAATGTLNSSSFSTPVSYPLSTGGFGIAIGDVNGDGRMDLVTSNFFADSFTVLRNEMTGSAINASSFVYDSSYFVGTGYGPLGITVADVDGDTKADVITANNFNNRISIFESYEVPAVESISGPDTICMNSTATYTSSHVDGATGYWSVANGHASVAWTPGVNDTTATVSGISAGTDTLMYTVVYLTDTNTVMKVIEIAPLADTGTITGPSQVCEGGTITLSNTVAGGMWSSSDTTIAAVDSMTGVVTGRNPGSAVIMYTTMSGFCGSMSASHAVTVLMGPDAGTITGLGGICVGQTTTLTASNTGGTWVNKYPAIASDVPSSTTDVVTGQSVGADTILYIMPSPSCGSDTAYHSLGVIDGVNSLPILGDTNMCVGTTTTLYNAAPGGVWVSDAPTVAFVNPVTGVVTAFNDGIAHITYTVTYTCGTVDTTVTIHVNPNPTVAPISDVTACNNSLVTIPLTSSVTPSSFMWTSSDTTIGIADSGTANPIVFTATDTATTSRTSTVTVWATASGCMSAPVTFNITVKPTARMTSTATPASICDNTTFAYTFTSNQPGTTFTWRRPAVTGISNTATSDTGAVISEVLHNTTADSVRVTYIDTMMYNGCTSIDSIHVYVKATPRLTTTTTTAICDSSLFTFTPSSATPGTTYAWTRNTVSGISNSAASGTGSINEYLNNTTATSHVVTYVYTLTASGCQHTQNIGVQVNPTPTLSSSTDTIVVCDSTPFTYYPASLTPGATYSWTRDTMAGISNMAASGTDTIMEYLVNVTNDPVTVSYLYTISANGCSDTQRIFVTVNPRAYLTSSLTPPAICSGDFFNYNPVANISGAAVSFSWYRNAVTGISNPTATGFGNPNEMLMNTINTFVDVPYVFTTNYLGCSYSQIVTVRVQPQPRLNESSSRICSGLPFSTTLTSTVSGTTFAWTRATVTGIIPDTSMGSGATIYDTLTNQTMMPLVASYVFTLTANGCSYMDTFVLTVDPKVTPTPTITTSGPDNVCLNTMYQNFGASVPPMDSVEYTWSAVNATIYAVGTSGQNAVVNFTTPGTAQIILTSNIIHISCATVDSFTVNVSNSEAPNPTVLYFNKQFVCLPADLDSYQWGYDDANLDSTILTGQTNQDYINATPDWSLYYWVMTSKGDCHQKTYYRAPNTVANVNMDEVTMKLYPNPASEMLTVEVNSSVSGDIQVQVFNMMGQLVTTAPLQNNKAQFQVNDLAAGSYLVTCYRNNVKVAASRFVKN
jgi:hypothetical protein